MSWILDEPFDSAVWLPPILGELPTVEGDPVALFLAGGPLTGKLTTFERLRRAGDPLIPTDPVPVHPVMLRHRLPEFTNGVEAGDEQAASTVRAETEDIARQLVHAAVSDARNVVLHGLGAGEPDAFATVLHTFADIGYEVRVLLVDCETDEALRRNAARAQLTGLAYDEAMIRRLHRDVSRRFEEWKALPGISWVMYGT